MGPAGGLLGTWSLLSPSALQNQLPVSEGLRDKSLFLPALEAMRSDSEKAPSAVCPQACAVKCPFWPRCKHRGPMTVSTVKLKAVAGTLYEAGHLLLRSLQGPWG